MSRSAKVLPTHTRALFDEAAAAAVELLQQGEVVALPTETVYGLAANAFDEKAVAAIYETKGRPAHNPIIVHVDGTTMAKRCTTEWPEAAQRLADAFWPGPLTLVLPKSDLVPAIVTADGPTVGVRWPGHPLMRKVIKDCGFPLAAPSANRSNEISPTNSEHVMKGMGDRLPLVVDGGQSQIGIESTVVDLTSDPVRILRPGLIHEESIEAAIGEDVMVGQDDNETLMSPGQLLKHYSPKAQVLIRHWDGDTELDELVAATPGSRDRLWLLTHTNVPLHFESAHVCVVPHDPEAYARALYAELHRCDEEGAEVILVEAVPDTAEWRGIADRLQRASA
ncbi:MAG: L-threonylcarbamoyladenylate synthase [Limisphaerales bacterium]